MNLFDIVGPIMVGPSSSHTAGAVRIGNVCRKLLGEEIRKAELGLHGSFASTGRGHGTDRALIAGLLGFSVDDERVPKSFEYAKPAGLAFCFSDIDLGPDAHPNSVLATLTGIRGTRIEIKASSIGGGQIRIDAIDGIETDFSGAYPTLIVHNEDKPGLVADVAAFLERANVNIATMKLYRNGRGRVAVMVIECDQEISEADIEKIRLLEGVRKVSYLRLKEEKHV